MRRWPLEGDWRKSERWQRTRQNMLSEGSAIEMRRQKTLCERSTVKMKLQTTPSDARTNEHHLNLREARVMDLTCQEEGLMIAMST